MTEIKVRKPTPIKIYGVGKLYDNYTNRWYKWRQSLPANGDHIKIVWFADNRGVTNVYIGFQGIVEDMDILDGTFVLKSESSILICLPGKFDYIKINETIKE